MSVAEGHGTITSRLRGFAGRGASDRADPFESGEEARWLARASRWLDRQLDIEARARSGFALIPIGLIVGAALVYGPQMRVALPMLAVALAAIAVLYVVAAGRPILRGLLLFCGLACVGIAAAEIELSRTETTMFSGSATVRIEGRVTARDIDDRGRYRYLVDIAATERPVLSRPPEEVRIFVSSRHEPIAIGGTYRGLVRIGPPSGPAFPGAYDFAFAPFFRGLGAYGFSLGAPEALAPDPGNRLSFSEKITALRIAMATRIRSVVGGAEGAVASALITGERAGIPDEIDEWLRVTGLAHVLSISGFHMALVAGFTMLAIRTLLSFVPALPLLVSTKKLAAVAALFVSTAYLLLAGDNVATQRSYIMLVIMLGAVLLDRPALTLRNVSLAAILVVVTSPHAVMTATFQMSFAATAALVGAYGALMRRHADRPGRAAPDRSLVAAVALFLGALALSSLLAGAATAPYGIYHFQRVAPFGLFANVLLMPIFSFWIMPLGLIAVLAMPFGLDAPLLALMGYGLTVVFALAERLAAWFPDHPTGLMTGSGLVLFSAAILIVCFFASRLRWLAAPVLTLGLLAASAPTAPPELLVFEDGKQVALIDAAGRLVHLKPRPNRFVANQWARAFPTPYAERPDTALRPPDPSAAGFTCLDEICRAVTRSGLRIAWTENYEKTGLLCETADIAIVSRAIRLQECRSGADLVTLRTLRRSGSLAISRASDAANGPAALTIARSIPKSPAEWNLHRHADWPEYWRNPDADAGAAFAGSASADPKPEDQ